MRTCLRGPPSRGGSCRPSRAPLGNPNLTTGVVTGTLGSTEPTGQPLTYAVNPHAEINDSQFGGGLHLHPTTAARLAAGTTTTPVSHTALGYEKHNPDGAGTRQCPRRNPGQDGVDRHQLGREVPTRTRPDYRPRERRPLRGNRRAKATKTS